jgi:hypothetical protein
MANSLIDLQRQTKSVKESQVIYSFIKKLTSISCFGFSLLFLIILLSGCGDITESSAVTSLVVTPTNATIGVNQTQYFYVVGKNAAGAVVTVTATWSLSGGIGTISSSTGIFTAGDTAATGYVIATYGSLTKEVPVTITIAGWLVGKIQAVDQSVVQGVKVYLKELPNYSDFSEADGTYSISGIPAGTYEAWTAETTIYQAASSEVTISTGVTVTWSPTLTTKPGTPTIPTTTLPVF